MIHTAAFDMFFCSEGEIPTSLLYGFIRDKKQVYDVGFGSDGVGKGGATLLTQIHQVGLVLVHDIKVIVITFFMVFNIKSCKF